MKSFLRPRSPLRALASLGIFHLASLALFGQGRVQFANTSTTLITTNSTGSPPSGQAHASGAITGANTFRIGLYVAPQGSTNPSDFTLVGLATNSPIFAGRFDGGIPFTIPGNMGQTIAFQIRAWPLQAGASYEQAGGAFYLGQSAIGFVTPGLGTQGSSVLFGTGAGQVGGFVLAPPWYFPPTVSINSPATGLLSPTPATVTVNVTAFSGGERSLAVVSLLTNGVVAAQAGPFPFLANANTNFVLSNLTAGYYTLRAQAENVDLLKATSAPVVVRVADRPVLAFARSSNGPIQFQFNSATGINYIVESGTLTNFSPVLTNAGTAGPITYSETNGSATQRTYRVRLK